MTLDLLILGASVRAAAFSARRANLRPTSIDLFADADLVALGATRRIARDDYPQGMRALAAEAAPGPWLYTGALENHPDLVDRIAADRPLWGNGGAVLRAIRDPFAWSDALHRAGLPCPAVTKGPEGLPQDRSWLVKPLASAGGHGIAPYEGPKPESPAGNVFYQERIEGLSLSAIFVGRPGQTTLHGVTRQLIGRPDASFAYVGSLGPWPITPIETARLKSLGDLLARTFGLRGLFGVDFILRDGHPWPVEINPRYTASVEVLELALGESLLSAHRSVFDTVAAPSVHSNPPRPHTSVGKLILFAPGRCSFPMTTRPRPASLDHFAIPTLGDRPQPGTSFEPGEPVATLFEHADRVETCLARLERRGARWKRYLLQGEEMSFVDTVARAPG